MYLAAAVWTVLTLGVASAQTPDPVTAVAPMLAQSQLVVDSTVVFGIRDGEALQARLAKTSPPILIAILPDSAVGDRVNAAAVEAAVYRLATSVGVSATVGLVLPQSGYFRATSNVLSPDAVDSMAMRSAMMMNPVGTAQEVSDFIAHVQTLSAGPVVPRGGPGQGSHGFPAGPVLIGLGIVGFVVWGIRTGRIRLARRARAQTGGQGTSERERTRG